MKTLIVGIVMFLLGAVVSSAQPEIKWQRFGNACSGWTCPNQVLVPHNVEIGLRSDGVIVWKNK